jgi:hypothetical protein
MTSRTATVYLAALGLAASAATTAAVIASTPTVVSSAAATARPELTSATVGQTTSNQAVPTLPFDQTTVVFNFDEPVTGTSPVAADFHIVGFDSNWRADGQSAAVQGDGRSVLVTFGSSSAPIGQQQITDTSLATVSNGAVSDDANRTSPDGAVPLGSIRTVTNEAGKTTGPDLLKVDNIRTDMTDPTHTLADFTFDMPVYRVNGGGTPHLVLQSSPSTQVGGSILQLNCTFSGDGKATLTAACNNPDPSNQGLPSVTTVTAGQVARGFVDAGAVSADPQNPLAGVLGPQGAVNVLQAASVSGPGATATPYLRDAIYHPGVTVKDSNGNLIKGDQVIYVFDQPVGIGTAFTGSPKCALQNGASGLPTGACFVVYTSDGRQIAASNVNGTSTSVDGNPPAIVKDNPNEVVATFRVGTLAAATGAAVADNAVTAATPAKSAGLADEVDQASPGGATITPGTIDGPTLTAVEIDKSHSPAHVNYVFNEDLKNGSLTTQTIPDFYLLGINGDQYTCQTATQAAGGQPGTNNSVTCSAFAIVDGTNKTGVSDAQLRAAVVGGVDHNAILFDNGTFGGIQNPEQAHAVSDPPAVHSVSPSAGPDTGGTPVTVIGTNFADVTAVSFDDTPATFTITSPTEITATAPAHAAGPVDISVTSGSGVSPQTPADVYYYQHGDQSPLILSGPTVEGVHQVGSTETCNVTKASGVSTAYQWTLDGVDVTGATNQTYRIAEGAFGRLLACRVTATTADQLQSGTSPPVRVRVGPALRNLKAPRIPRQPQVNHYASVTTGSWSPAATSYSYQWYVSGKKIAGATAPRYRVPAKYRGKSLICRVTASRRGWHNGHARTATRHVAE